MKTIKGQTLLAASVALACAPIAHAEVSTEFQGQGFPRSILYCQPTMISLGKCAYPNAYGTPHSLIALPASSTPSWGRTIAQAQSNFAYNQYINAWKNPYFGWTLRDMDNGMLARWSTELKRLDSGGYTFSILAYAAQKSTPATLQRLASAFGTAEINSALPWAWVVWKHR